MWPKKVHLRIGGTAVVTSASSKVSLWSSRMQPLHEDSDSSTFKARILWLRLDLAPAFRQDPNDGLASVWRRSRFRGWLAHPRLALHPDDEPSRVEPAVTGLLQILHDNPLAPLVVMVIESGHAVIPQDYCPALRHIFYQENLRRFDTCQCATSTGRMSGSMAPDRSSIPVVRG